MLRNNQLLLLIINHISSRNKKRQDYLAPSFTAGNINRFKFYAFCLNLADFLKESLVKSGLPGEVFVWHDMLYDVPWWPGFVHNALSKAPSKDGPAISWRWYTKGMGQPIKHSPSLSK